jgi:hypothetical protein
MKILRLGGGLKLPNPKVDHKEAALHLFLKQMPQILVS